MLWKKESFNFVKLWFFQYVNLRSSSSITWELIRKRNSQNLHQTYWIRDSRGWPQNVCAKKHSWWLLCTLSLTTAKIMAPRINIIKFGVIKVFNFLPMMCSRNRNVMWNWPALGENPWSLSQWFLAWMTVQENLGNRLMLRHDPQDQTAQKQNRNCSFIIFCGFCER